MVKLTKIYTKTGDKGTTALATGDRVAKHDPRIDAYGTCDEANAILGIVRLHLGAWPTLDHTIGLIQNDLFDLGADLATPDSPDLGWTPLRTTDAQVTRLETDIDTMNGALKPLDSFVLPGGHPAAAYLHQARTVVRRAERQATLLAEQTPDSVNQAAIRYLNRLSDLLFVASRWVNLKSGAGDVKWVPGQNRD